MSLAQELLKQTLFIEKELGPCVLLVKCCELLGDHDERARIVARQITLGELTRLAQVDQRAFGMNQLSEQFLRTIYAFQVAGPQQQALVLFKQFTARMKAMKGPVGSMPAFRITAAAVVVDDQSSVFADILPSGSFAQRLALAWQGSDSSLLEDCCEELENAIEAAENEGSAVPWQDDWNYILLRRLRSKIARPQKV